jgi:hypothetical protein
MSRLLVNVLTNMSTELLTLGVVSIVESIAGRASPEPTFTLTAVTGGAVALAISLILSFASVSGA